MQNLFEMNKKHDLIEWPLSYCCVKYGFTEAPQNLFTGETFNLI